MDLKKFGGVLIFIGFISLAMCAYFCYSAHEMRFDIAEAISKKIMGSSSAAMRQMDLEIKQKLFEEKGFYFGIAGGLFMLLGIGLKTSAKPSQTIKANVSPEI